MKKSILPLLIAVFGLTTFTVSAQDAAIENDGYQMEEAVEEDEEKGLSISGFVDGYYMYNFNETGFPTSFTDSHNSFNLGMANIVVSKETGKVGFVADLAVGPRAEAANGYTGSTLSAIKQLYVTYSPSDAVTLTFGNFGTFVGYELIDAPANANYSTSYLFSNGPFYHTGLKADFALGENFGAMVGVFNDTDTKFDEVEGKHFGAQLSTTQGGLGAYLNVLYGKEEELGDKDLNGFQVDLTATYDVSDNFMLGLNASDKSSSVDGTVAGGFTGAALYATLGLSDAVALSARGEYFSMKDGDDAIDDESILALTLSGNITLGDGLTLIPEFRIDSASSDTFFWDAGDNEFVGSNGAFILAAVYGF